jgi:hypothetical protein
MILPRTIIKKKCSSSIIENTFLVSYRFFKHLPKKLQVVIQVKSPSCSWVLFSYFLSHQLRQTVELLDMHSKKSHEISRHPRADTVTSG